MVHYSIIFLRLCSLYEYMLHSLLSHSLMKKELVSPDIEDHILGQIPPSQLASLGLSTSFSSVGILFISSGLSASQFKDYFKSLTYKAAVSCAAAKQFRSSSTRDSMQELAT